MALTPTRATMDSRRMRPDEADRCRWVGWTFLKGVVDPARGIVAWAEGGDSGLHGEIVQRFGGVDPNPRCYDRDAPIGFGTFARVVRFVPPDGGPCVLGVDWSLVEPPHIGVATAASRVAEVAATLVADDTAAEDELALLNCRMCEDVENEAWRLADGLVTVRDWARAAFAPRTDRCPTCGRRTFADPTFRFCFHCSLPNPGGPHGLEDG